MTVDELNEFQQTLDAGQALDPDQCAQLLAEIWRLKAVNSGKAIEARVAREESAAATASLSTAQAENSVLRRELEHLATINGAAECELEMRWSNCAVRRRKGAACGSHLPAFDLGTPKNSGE